MLTSKQMDSIRPAIVKAGGGRGFIIEHRREVPPFKGKRLFASDRLVITAAHCLPHFPPCHPSSHSYERTYKRLLGTFDAGQPEVWAECVFADPIADIAVLSHPDYQVHEQASAYDGLTEEPPALRVGKAARKGTAWLPALDGQWISASYTIGLNDGGLWIKASQEIGPGMSGSPILADGGAAIGLVSVGTDETDSDGLKLQTARTDAPPAGMVVAFAEPQRNASRSSP